MTDPGNNTPKAALILGVAGLVPFFALSAAIALRLQTPYGSASLWLAAYGAVILSFMGGAQWGITVARPGRGDNWRAYAVSVIPALVAWPALFLPITWALATLSVTFACLLGYDLWTVRRGEAPEWYGQLRLGLTAAVVLCLTFAILANKSPI
ncbi:MAG: DUF3429 domain-containing protein [Alphaproteobacteria bacterium PA2]|nr:MAG: DUF3429 domain-containing protein [Alphaproteobacteria bacterium PA2]